MVAPAVGAVVGPRVGYRRQTTNCPCGQATALKRWHDRWATGMPNQASRSVSEARRKISEKVLADGRTRGIPCGNQERREVVLFLFSSGVEAVAANRTSEERHDRGSEPKATDLRPRGSGVVFGQRRTTWKTFPPKTTPDPRSRRFYQEKRIIAGRPIVGPACRSVSMPSRPARAGSYRHPRRAIDRGGLGSGRPGGTAGTDPIPSDRR